MILFKYAKRYALTKLGYRNVNDLLTFRYRKRHATLTEGRLTPIIVSGSQRSGTTFLAESIAAATHARLLFEPLMGSMAYRTMRALTRPQLLHFSPDLEAALTWLMTSDLPYNHAVDAIAKSKHYDRRLIKDLRLGFDLHAIAKANPNVPIIHIIRHPLDAIRSHLKLQILNDHFKSAYSKVARILQDKIALERYPWLTGLDVSMLSVADLQLVVWCVENAAAHAQAPAENLLIIRYEDIVQTGHFPDELWNLLRRFGIEPDLDRVDLKRPSSTTITAELEALEQGRMVMKFRDFFDDEQIAGARRILAMAGLMRDDRTTIFGHDIS